MLKPIYLLHFNIVGYSTKDPKLEAVLLTKLKQLHHSFGVDCLFLQNAIWNSVQSLILIDT